MQTLPLNVDRKDVDDFARRWGVRKLALFGSILRDDFGPRSDVDVLVTFHDGLTLTFESNVGMREELSRLFGGREIDLVEERRLGDPYRRHEILRTQEPVFATIRDV